MCCVAALFLAFGLYSSLFSDVCVKLSCMLVVSESCQWFAGLVALRQTIKQISTSRGRELTQQHYEQSKRTQRTVDLRGMHEQAMPADHQ